MIGLRCYGALQVKILGLCLSAHLRSVPLEMMLRWLISFFECLWRFACLPTKLDQGNFPRGSTSI